MRRRKPSQPGADNRKAAASSVELASGVTALGIFAGVALAAYNAVSQVRASSLFDAVLPAEPV